MEDFEISNHGSILILLPKTEQASDWIEEKIDPNAQRWAGGVVIEPRYWPDIQNGIEGDGMTVA